MRKPNKTGSQDILQNSKYKQMGASHYQREDVCVSVCARKSRASKGASDGHRKEENPRIAVGFHNRAEKHDLNMGGGHC